MALARFDIMFTVQSNTPVRQPGGSIIDNWADKFTLRGSFKQNNTRKVLESGVFVDVTYYNLQWRYEQDKSIAISDRVIINGIEYIPVGNCITDKIDHPRFYTQTLTIHG